MGPGKFIWERVAGSRLALNLALLAGLGAVAYLLFRQAGALGPLEGAVLVVATAGLLRLGVALWDWHQGMSLDGALVDWVQRIRQGERATLAPPEGMRIEQRHVVEAMNTLITDAQDCHADLMALRQAMARDWRDLDGLLDTIQRHHAADAAARIQGSERLETLGRELNDTFEGTFRLDQMELNHRLRADQHRFQSQAFRATLGQVQAGLDQLENLMEELRDSFPRLRREEEALGRLADAGLRQSARLGLAVKGLVARTPKLVDESRTRIERLRHFRHAADAVRDQTEALARRMESFRDEAQTRIRSFAGAQGSMKGLDHVAQQAGLLAVNAAIIGQQGGGGAGMTAIGGRLRQLADETAEGVSEMERTLDGYQRGLGHETSGLWDLQEVTERLLAGIHDLLRTAGQLDQQGDELERALETQLGQVDQVRQASEHAELSLHEVGERARALEGALGRQWGVEAKITPERERLSRQGTRLADFGNELTLTSQKNIDEVWDILARHQEVRKTEAYRRVISGELAHPPVASDETELTWNRIEWARTQRRPRFAGVDETLPPLGRRDADDRTLLLLLGQDALDGPEPSALESCTCDATGRIWDLRFLDSLRTESHRLALMELLKESPLPACFAGLDMRISPEGVQLRLPSPYPGLPRFLAGLRLELPLEPDLWNHPFRSRKARTAVVQRLVWIGPGAGGGPRHQGLRLIHSWVRNDPRHEFILPELAHEGHRPDLCPFREDQGVLDEPLGLPPVRCVALGTDPASLFPLRDQLAQAGAAEGPGGMALCAIGLGHAHPEALLLRLFQQGVDLADAFHPDLVPYQIRMREEVLGGSTGDPYRAAWTLLEDLQRQAWLMPLP